MINWETFHSRDGNEMIVNMETAQKNNPYHTTGNTAKKKKKEKEKKKERAYLVLPWRPC